jgi:hypothetical protein
VRERGRERERERERCVRVVWHRQGYSPCVYPCVFTLLVLLVILLLFIYITYYLCLFTLLVLLVMLLQSRVCANTLNLHKLPKDVSVLLFDVLSMIIPFCFRGRSEREEKEEGLRGEREEEEEGQTQSLCSNSQKMYRLGCSHSIIFPFLF